jgi:hypothetical protein
MAVALSPRSATVEPDPSELGPCTFLCRKTPSQFTTISECVPPETLEGTTFRLDQRLLLRRLPVSGQPLR